MDAIPIKNTNSAVIARRELRVLHRWHMGREGRTPEYIQNHNVIRDYEKSKSDRELLVNAETK